MAVKYEKLTPRAFENAISRLLNHENLSHNDRCAIADYALTELRRQCGEESPEYVDGGWTKVPMGDHPNFRFARPGEQFICVDSAQQKWICTVPSLPESNISNRSTT